MKKNRETLAPLSPAQWPKELEHIHRGLGSPLNIHNIMAHNTALTLAWMPFRDHIVANSSLQPRQRELLILRTAFNCDAAYEWEHHVVRGKLAGLSDVDIERVKEGPNAGQWPPADQLLLRAADEIHRESRIRALTLDELCQCFDDCQQLDIIATVGMYITLAVIIKTYKVPLEDH
jgi:alkylhydroperoxidase family enzyme